MKTPHRFTTTLFAAVLAVSATLGARADIGIISPAEAKQLIEDPDPSKRPVVIDTRGGYKDYFRGHLPTAHHLNFDTLRGTDLAVPVQYLPDELTRALLKRAGVDKDRLHILFADGATLPNDQILSASMVAHVLEKLGIENIRILDGGYNAWIDAGFEGTQAYFGNPEGDLPAEGKPEIAATIEDILAAQRAPDTIIVDARPPNEFAGDDDVWFRKGHIPGALNFFWAKLMAEDNTHQFRPVAEVKKELEAAGITPDKKIVCYCGTSREGSLLRFYLKFVAGYPNVTLYEGAWKEYVWLNNQSLPVETGSGE